MTIKELAKQFARFGAVGALNTGLDYLLFMACVYLLGTSVVVANVVSMGLATVNSFILNRAWTFGTDGPRGHVASHSVRFLVLGVLMFALSTAAVALLAEVLPPWLAKLLSIPPLMVLNFWLMRRYVFH